MLADDVVGVVCFLLLFVWMLAVSDYIVNVYLLSVFLYSVGNPFHPTFEFTLPSVLSVIPQPQPSLYPNTTHLYLYLSFHIFSFLLKPRSSLKPERNVSWCSKHLFEHHFVSKQDFNFALSAPKLFKFFLFKD